MRLRWLAVLVCTICFGPVPAMAAGDDLAAEVAKLKERLAVLEAELAKTSASQAATRAALERDLAQPMLLLVGEWPCPYGFKRIETRVMILTRSRTATTGPLFDEAGLSGEDPPGVGNNVYRDLDFCYRLPKAVGIE